MGILTESSILSRVKAQDLSTVRKLNCWGSDLTDVSIVRKMTFVEVLSLSVNNISTLADFSYCTNLQELYLRKNNIVNLNELCYLKRLLHLHSLWLADNPCAERENYRLTALRALPNLKRLDNVLVQPDEIVKAAILGDALEYPLGANSIIIENPECRRPLDLSPIASTVACHISKLNGYGIADEQTDLQSTSIQSLIPQSKMMLPCLPVSKLCSASSDADIVFKSNPSRDIAPRTNPPEQCQAFQARVQTLCDYPLSETDHLVTDTIKNDNLLGDHLSENCFWRKEETLQMPDDPDDTASSGDGYLQILKRSDEAHGNRQEENLSCLNKNAQTDEKSTPSRNFRKTVNSNVLSAVLCLVKELDPASLQVVKTAIRCRMDEMND